MTQEPYRSLPAGRRTRPRHRLPWPPPTRHHAAALCTRPSVLSSATHQAGAAARTAACPGSGRRHLGAAQAVASPPACHVTTLSSRPQGAARIAVEATLSRPSSNRPATPLATVLPDASRRQPQSGPRPLGTGLPARIVTLLRREALPKRSCPRLHPPHQQLVHAPRYTPA